MCSKAANGEASQKTQPTRREILQALSASSALALTRMTAAAAIPPQAEAGTPSKTVQAEAAKKWKGSSLGSLYPFVKQVQEEGLSSLAYLRVRPKDLEAWKAEARARVFDLFLYRPAPCDPSAQVLERVDKGDYIREYLRFNTTPEIEAPAYLLIPKRAKFPVPAVVALHCHGGYYYWGKEKIVEIENEHPALVEFRREVYDGSSFPVTLARHGYAVIVIDMFYFGERRLILDSDLEQGINDRSKPEPAETINTINSRNGQYESIFVRNMLMSGFTWGGVLAWDDIRTIDYLQTRPEVNPNRIACVGLSVGGYRSTFLAALDPRIKAACVAGWMTSWRDLIPGFEHHTMISGVTPGLLKYLDYPDVGSLTIPNPLMVVHGWRDTLFPTQGVLSALSTLRQCYEAAGKPERFATYTFDGPHKFPARAQQLMLEWFNRWV
jgi:dienelactone hydrolase